MVQELDLSSNRITSIDGFLPYLIKCEKLVLDDNLIEELSYFDDKKQRNDGKNLGGKKLRILSLKRNPICENETIIRRISDSALNKIVII